jgi:hypothetical protein
VVLWVIVPLTPVTVMVASSWWGVPGTACAAATSAAAASTASRQYRQREAHQQCRCSAPAWAPRLVEQKQEHGAQRQGEDELVIHRTVKSRWACRSEPLCWSPRSW